MKALNPLHLLTVGGALLSAAMPTKEAKPSDLSPGVPIPQPGIPQNTRTSKSYSLQGRSKALANGTATPHMICTQHDHGDDELISASSGFQLGVIGGFLGGAAGRTFDKWTMGASGHKGETFGAAFDSVLVGLPSGVGIRNHLASQDETTCFDPNPGPHEVCISPKHDSDVISGLVAGIPAGAGAGILGAIAGAYVHKDHRKIGAFISGIANAVGAGIAAGSAAHHNQVNTNYPVCYDPAQPPSPGYIDGAGE